jgi:hypothetical protein
LSVLSAADQLERDGRDQPCSLVAHAFADPMRARIWSACSAAVDLTDLGGPDPIAALACTDSATHRGRSEPKPVTYAARRAEAVRAALLEPVADAKGDVPVVLLVAGAGFLGTGTTAALHAGGKPEKRADLQRPRQAGERRLRLA